MNKNGFTWDPNSNTYTEAISDSMTYPKFPYHNIFLQEQTQSILSSRISVQFRDACESDDPFFTMNTLRTALITSSGLVWALAGFIPGVGLGIAAAGGVINVLLPVLWNEDTTASDQALMCSVGNLINEKISQYAFSAASAYLEGLQHLLRKYNETIQMWQNPQNNKLFQKAAEDVREMFREVHSHFIVAMPMFRIAEFEIQLLPIYTKAATFHLLILNDVIKFGREYGFDTATVAGFQKDFMEVIEEYTDHCSKTYQQGLGKAKKMKADLTDEKKYPWALMNFERYQSIEDWNLFNEYRRTMTVLVLDLVAIWPTLNPTYYPSMLKVPLTREVYTNIQGSYIPYNDSLTPEKIENTIVRKPHLFTFLNEIIMCHLTKNEELCGAHLLYSRTGSSDISLYLQGFDGYYSCRIQQFPINETKVWFNGIDKLSRIDFSRIKDKQLFTLYQCGQYYAPEAPPATKNPIFSNAVPEFSNNMLEIPKTTPDFEIPQHNLSWISLGKASKLNDRTIDYLAFGWVHPSIDRNNTVSTNQITQIPAVMANNLSGQASVIEGPNTTGGDLVELIFDPKEVTKTTIELKILLPPVVNQEYRIRIRYASDTDTVLNTIFRQNNTEVAETNMVSKSSPELDASLSFKSFNYAQLMSQRIINNTMNQTCILRIENIGIQNQFSRIIIDKIEFIPVFL